MADLLEDIDHAFASDPLIDEIGVIMCPPPPNVVLIDHKLGLSYLILKSLFAYSLSEFYLILSALKHDHIKLSDPITADKVMRLTRAALVVKGDMPMLYNIRKMAVLEGNALSNIEEELFFLSVLFTKHPKSPSSWQHRKWCLNERYFYQRAKEASCYPKDITASSPTTKKFPLKMTLTEVQIELDLCSKMSESYPKNYYSWMHRLWLLQFMNINELESEMLFTKTWLNSHVSDHSASSHRQEVIQRILFLISSPSTHGNGDSYGDVACSINDLDGNENVFSIVDKDISDIDQIKIIDNECNNNGNNIKDNNSNFNNINDLSVHDNNKDGSTGSKDDINLGMAYKIRFNRLKRFLSNLATDLGTENLNIFLSNSVSPPCLHSNEKSSAHEKVKKVENVLLDSKNQFNLNDRDDNLYFQLLFLTSTVKDCRQLIFDRPGKFLSHVNQYVD